MLRKATWPIRGTWRYDTYSHDTWLHVTIFTCCAPKRPVVYSHTTLRIPSSGSSTLILSIICVTRKAAFAVLLDYLDYISQPFMFGIHTFPGTDFFFIYFAKYPRWLICPPLRRRRLLIYFFVLHVSGVSGDRGFLCIRSAFGKDEVLRAWFGKTTKNGGCGTTALIYPRPFPLFLLSLMCH
jgi:hypothetical protein